MQAEHQEYIGTQTGADGQDRELLFVTLDKSGKDFSPSTRYRDFAISRDRFHWETQSAAGVTTSSGKRYIDSPGNGWTFYLFVRPSPDDAYAFLGPVVYESHAGDRPIAITWSYPLHVRPAVRGVRHPRRRLRTEGPRIWWGTTATAPRTRDWTTGLGFAS